METKTGWVISAGYFLNIEKEVDLFVREMDSKIQEYMELTPTPLKTKE